MTRTTYAIAACAALSAGAASAQGLDRSGQNINVIFEEGDYAELAIGSVNPTITGADTNPLLAPFAQDTGNVAGSFVNGSIAYKQQLNDSLSFALIVDQPYGADINYDSFDPFVSGSLALGDTSAVLNSSSLTAMGRYEFGNGFSIHGGLRAQRFDAEIALNGVAYGGLNGYSTTLEADTALGWQAGVAYEIPDIAFRVALTYFSDVEHDVDSQEFFGGAPLLTSTTTITTPEAINLDFQTGIAPDTLLFGGFRYADYSSVVVSPDFFALNTGGASLVSIGDTRVFRIGVGRRFNDKLSGLVSISYSPEDDDDLVSPLAPSNGSLGITLGGAYNVSDMVTLSGGINYTKVGDARPETGTPDIPWSTMTDNSVVGIGAKIGIRF